MNNRGMILIAVLIIMVALVSMVMIIEIRSSKNFDYASKLLMQNQAALYFNSAIKVAERLLKNDSNKYDAPSDDWNNLPPFRANADTTVSLSISPVNARININNVTSENKLIAERTQSAIISVLSDNGIDGHKALKNIIAWLSPRTAQGQNPKSYNTTKNSFFSLKELDYINGLGGLSSKFHNYFTVSGAMGRININFAPMEVLEAYLPEISDCVGSIIDYRKKEPFKNVTQIMKVDCIDDKTYLKILPFITTVSNLFDVRVDVNIDGNDFEAEMLLERIGKSVRLVKYFEGKGYYE